MQKNYEIINTTVSALLSFNGLFAPYNERLHLLSINTKEGGTQNKTHVPSSVLLLCTYSWSFFSV